MSAARNALLGVVLTASSSIAAAVGTTGISGDSIRIGMINAQTGGAASLGLPLRRGVEAVFDEVNAEGGIGGRRLELVVADDGYEPERSIAAALELLEHDRVFALTGLVGTPTASALLPILEDFEVPVVGVLSGAELLREPRLPAVFNLRASYVEEVEALVEHFASQGSRRFGVLYQNDAFGLSLLTAVEASLAARELELVATSTYRRNTTAVKTGLLAMMDANPDAILMAGTGGPVARFIELARRMGVRSRFGTLSFAAGEAFVEAVGRPGNGTVVSQVMPSPDSELPVVQQCRRLMAERSDHEFSRAGLEGCLYARVLVEALRRSGSNPDRKSLVAALESMSPFDLGGLAVDLAPDRAQGLDFVSLSQVRAGVLEVIE